jgi:hypothetical protein
MNRVQDKLSRVEGSDSEGVCVKNKQSNLEGSSKGRQSKESQPKPPQLTENQSGTKTLLTPQKQPETQQDRKEEEGGAHTTPKTRQ